ncbi:polyketide cyclase/dehydrase/lipid transport protein [Pseudonocardia hierapolitana]|uniref:Polyketide cyclase/dehydrase/lipid transport protein n=1 Tax=Pseudonocardia hierapolitana TaxID=1128676 RepID=A0A561SZ72_9PSEU|nr:SRPBCC family protein [Pseudonocardia hierapolitana]TWF80160.1 polyketide cyclase/dehydrase/lipid transport protein [Pseudonocardia hierapolitana]
MAEGTDRAGLKEALPTDALKDAGQRLLGLMVQSAAENAAQRIGNLSDRLTDVAENPGQGLGTVLGRRREQTEDTDAEGEGGSPGGALRRGLSTLKEKIGNVFGGGGGGQGKKLKVTVISEDQDIGLPLRTTYNLWTQFADFPSFMKKVESVEQESDEKTNWKAQVFWSHRTWEATIAEQVPDSHIVWRSKGPKGHVDGAVSFTELGPNLTRVMMVLEYHPQGLFERTGNLWRAQGRRARLEFQHFRRHAMANVILHQEEVEGWRGEIRDNEVVKTHEEALEEEQRAQQPEPEEETGAEEPEESSEAADERAEEEQYEEEPAEEEPYDEDAGYSEEDEYVDEGEPVDEADLEDEYVDAEPDEDAEAREPVAASRSRRGR